jgi:inner membrane protein involved in colicin E2 resistance
VFKRIFPIVFIYLMTVFAWLILGATVQFRTYNIDTKLEKAVSQLWGTSQRQEAPLVYYQTKETTTQMIDHKVPLDASKIKVGLKLGYRRKGLLWYSTYRVNFSGKYRFANLTTEPREMFFELPLPAADAVYDNPRFLIGGHEVEDIQIEEGVLKQAIRLEAGQAQEVEISYGSQGMDEWWYDFGDNVSQIKNFSLTMDTDFKKIDFPENSISPTKKVQTKDGWRLNWNYARLLSGVQIGMVMPKKLNPGPWTSKVTFFAPVSLFFFFFLIFIFTILRDIKIHPMNYFFVAAAFFSFHLLLAYLVDHIDINLAFLICSLVSIFLVISYMRLVVGERFAFLEIGISQFVYLVLFSYTFFFEGFTGLTVTIMAIITLFLVMQFTGRVDWEEALQMTGRIQPVKTGKDQAPK